MTILADHRADIQEALEHEQQETLRWQRESFPQDPVLLYRIDLWTRSGEQLVPLFALPKTELPNMDAVQTSVFFDVVQGDQLVEMAFFGMSVRISKVVFCTFAEVRMYPALTVVDEDRRAVRASKIFLGLTGIGR